jgi:uncharacterized membrane protein
VTQPRLYDPGRLLAFCDGVIAIAITLLVLGLEVPSAQNVPEKKLPEFLLDSNHALLGYLVSFLVIGTYWLQHYTIFHFIQRVNRPFVLLNGLFLLLISFIPFPTGLQATYRYDELAVVLYGSTHLLCGLTLLAIWIYATRQHRLVIADISPEVVTSMTRRITLTPIICVVAIGLAFVNIVASKLLFLIIPVFYFSHRAIERGNMNAQEAD